jgi:hypothetical protein
MSGVCSHARGLYCSLGCPRICLCTAYSQRSCPEVEVDLVNGADSEQGGDVAQRVAWLPQGPGFLFCTRKQSRQHSSMTSCPSDVDAVNTMAGSWVEGRVGQTPFLTLG